MRSLLSLVPLLLLSACAGDPTVVPVAPPAPKPVVAAKVEEPLLGVLTSRKNEMVAAQIDGRIVQVLAATGKQVKKGDPIVDLDPTTLNARIAGANAQIDQAKSNIAIAGTEINEASRQVALEQRVFNAGAAPLEQVRLARASLQKAQATGMRANADLKEAEANKKMLEDELAFTHIVAPIDGTVALVKAQSGQVVNPGAQLARVFDPNDLMVRFQVTRDRRLEVQPGTVITLTLPGTAEPVQARVTNVSSDLEPPLEFAIAEADVIGKAPAGAQIGELGDVRIAR